MKASVTTPNSARRIPREAGFVNPSKLPRGPNGFALCRNCSKECPTKQNTFCGPACVHEWKCRTDPGYQARQVLKRDKGVCALCGVDTLAQKASVCALRDAALRERTPESYVAAINAALEIGMLPKRNAKTDPTYMVVCWIDTCRRPWDMDHIVPVVEGGGSCGLENLRTLCRPCHKAETKKLAGRRAEAKRKAVAS